jgi:hypothetical protein
MRRMGLGKSLRKWKEACKEHFTRCGHYSGMTKVECRYQKAYDVGGHVV